MIKPPERIIDSQSIYEGRIVQFRVDTIALPDGSITTREIIGTPGAVAIVPLTDDGHRSPSDRIGDKIVAVGIEALDGHEEIARPDLPRVLSQPLDVHLHVAVNFLVG